MSLNKGLHQQSGDLDADAVMRDGSNKLGLSGFLVYRSKTNKTKWAKTTTIVDIWEKQISVDVFL